jgi:Domain of unknown function DUF29
VSSLYDTDFGAWLEAQVHALATGTWAALDIPHLCDELDGVRRHYLHELEWSLTQLIEARLVWEYAPEQRSDWWQGHMNATHSHLETFLDRQATFRQVLGQRYPVLYQHAIHGLQRYHHMDPNRWPRREWSKISNGASSMVSTSLLQAAHTPRRPYGWGCCVASWRACSKARSHS